MKNEKILEIKELNLAIGEIEILKNINLQIYKGDWVSIIGANGSGKSSIVKSIARLVNFDGEILFQKENIDKISARDFFSKTGICFQTLSNFSNIICYNFLEMSFFSFRGKISEELIQSKISSISKELGLSHLLKRKLNQLSGGELQKMHIASALIKSPQLLILDEIYNHLDPLVQDQITDVLMKFNKLGGTIIFITHNLEKIMHYSNRIIALKKREIIFDGLSSAINPEVLHSIYKKKFKIISDDGLEYILG